MSYGLSPHMNLGYADPFSQMGIGASPVDKFSQFGLSPAGPSGMDKFLGNLKGMGPLQMLGTAYGVGDVGYNLFTKNEDLYWGPRATTNAVEGAMSAFALSGGNPIVTGVGAVTGYLGGKF